MKCDGLLGGAKYYPPGSKAYGKPRNQEIHSICAKHNQHVLYARNILNNRFNLI